MLQKQDVYAVGADENDCYARFVGDRLAEGADYPKKQNKFLLRPHAIPRNEIRILNRFLSRSAGGLLRCVLPGILAGTWLAGMPGPAFAAPTSAEQSAAWLGEQGVASYYGQRHQGHRTASGSRFEQTALTAAHPWLPFGTQVRVTLASGRSVVVTITDRLPSRRRVIDLSLAAARALGIVSQGIAQVSLTPA